MCVKYIIKLCEISSDEVEFDTSFLLMCVSRVKHQAMLHPPVFVANNISGDTGRMIAILKALEPLSVKCNSDIWPNLLSRDQHQGGSRVPSITKLIWCSNEGIDGEANIFYYKQRVSFLPFKLIKWGIMGQHIASYGGLFHTLQG